MGRKWEDGTVLHHTCQGQCKEWMGEGGIWFVMEGTGREAIDTQNYPPMTPNVDRNNLPNDPHVPPQ